MTSNDWPNVFCLVARLISTNSAAAGFSIFAATVIFAFFRTGSGISDGRPVAGPSGFGSLAVVVFFCTGSVGSEGSSREGPAVFLPTVVVSLFGTGSGGAEDCAGGRNSDSILVREFAFSSICPASFGGLAAGGFEDVAISLAFIAGSGLNGVRFRS